MYKTAHRLRLIWFALTALCSQASASSATELNVLYSASNLMTPIQKHFKNEFERDHSVRVNIEPALEYTDALAIALRQSLVGSAHDVGFYGMSDVCILASRGLAKPLDILIKNDPEWSKLGLPENVLDVTKCTSKTYAIPFSASYMVIIFNKKLVAEVGENPNELPNTWPDILELARKIKGRSGGISFNYDGSSSWSFMTLVLSQGGSILTSDGKDIAFDSKEGLKALQILADIGRARGNADLSKAQGRQAFVSGTLGILVDSSSGLSDYKKAARGSFEIGLVPFPVAENGKVPASGMGIVLHSTSEDRIRPAWKYMKYAVSADSQAYMGKMTGFQPFNQIAIVDRLAAYYAENPEFSIAAESAKNATAWPSFPGPNGLKIHQIITNHLQRVYTGTMTPELALASMAKATRDLIK